MTSEIRANTIKNRVGLGTVSFTNTGPVVSGIVTATGIELTGSIGEDIARIKIPDGMNGAPFTGNLEFGNNRDFVMLHDGHHNYVKANNGNIYVTVGGNVLTTLQTSGSVLLNKDLDVDGHTNLDNVSIAGVATATTFVGNLTGNVTGNISGGTVGGSTGTFSGDVSITDKIVHTDDTNTAIRFPSDDTISFETGGSEKVRITSAGDVGIGYDSPTVKLHVREAASGFSGTYDNRYHVIVEDDAEAYVGFYVPNNGYAGVRFSDTTGLEGAIDYYFGDDAMHFHSTATHIFKTAGSERLRITSAGHLQLQGGTIYGDDSALPTFTLQNTSGNSNHCRIVLGNNVGSDNGGIEFWTAGSSAATKKFSIRGNNNYIEVIGTNTLRFDDGKLNINHNSSNAYIRNTTGQLLYRSATHTFENAAGSTEYLRITSNGHLSLGTAGDPASSNGNVTKKFGIRSSQNNVIIGETSATSEHTGFILEARQTGRSGNARIAQINMGNDSGADGRIKFQTAADGADVANRLWISKNGIRSYATFVDTSYHANPDPFADGSGLAYYRLNNNFHDSGLYAQHGTASQGSPNKEFNASPHFSLVNSSGEPCWDNPNEGAITIPNLKNSYPFSMAAWINVSSWPTSSNNDLIMNLSIANQRVSLCIVVWGGTNYSDFSIMYGGTNHWTFTPTSRPTNEWIHVVYSVVGSNNSGHKVYQNGTSLTASNQGGGHGGAAGWAIGGNASNSERFSMGRIGSIRFFNKAISSSEASALYTNDQFYT